MNVSLANNGAASPDGDASVANLQSEFCPCQCESKTLTLASLLEHVCLSSKHEWYRVLFVSSMFMDEWKPFPLLIDSALRRSTSPGKGEWEMVWWGELVIGTDLSRQFFGVEPYWGLFDENRNLKDITIPTC
jgi:hypothetical protein